MIRKAAAGLLVLSLAAVFACAPGPREASVPDNFITYTYPDEFSLSFPDDWELDYSYEGSVMELSEKMANDPGRPPLSVVQTVLYGGLRDGSDYEPTVTVSVVPRFYGFSTLDEIYETDSRMFTETVPEYMENKVTRTTVDGREVTIVDSQDNQPEYGERRYLVLTTPEGVLVWYVVCSVATEDYDRWEETFTQVVSSLMIAQ